MAGNIQRIVKDGLRAFIFWAVASVVMIYLWGQIGEMASALLGFVFILSFCVLRFTELVAWLTTLGKRPQGPPPAWKPPASAPPAPPVQQQYCPKCGAQWVAGAQRCANCS